MSLKARTRKLQRDAAAQVSAWIAGLSREEHVAAIRFTLRHLTPEQARARFAHDRATRSCSPEFTEKMMAIVFPEETGGGDA